MENPFEAPQEDSLPRTHSEVRRRHGRGAVASADFITLGFMIQVFSVPALLIGLVLLLIKVWLVGSAILLLGILIFAAGRGLAAYKLWAWYAAVGVALPLAILFMAGFVLRLLEGRISLFMLVTPAISVWICWVLMSRSGRDRYRVLAQAAASRKRKAAARPAAEFQEIAPPPPAAEPAPGASAGLDALDDLHA